MSPRFAAGIGLAVAAVLILISSASDAAQVEPTSDPQADCLCTLEFRPVCDVKNEVIASNACAALCDGYAEDQFQACAPVQPANAPQSECICTFLYRPVCETSGAGLPIAANDCVAKCQGYEESQFTPCFEATTKERVATAQTCACPAIYAPVCDKYGNEVAPSDCVADCDGVAGYIPCAAFLAHADAISPAGPPMPQPCITTLEYAPVCTSEGMQVGSNLGEAACKGYTEDQLELCYPPEEPQGLAVPEGNCPCTRELLPMCLSNGTQVGDNPCEAECNGYSGQVVPCEVIQVDRPAVAVNIEPRPACKCTKEYKPQCNAATGVEVAPSPCNAECIGYLPDQVEDCKQKKPLHAAVNKLCQCSREVKRVCDKFGTALGHNACSADCKGYSPEQYNEENCGVTQPECQPCTFEYRPVCDERGTELGSNACEAKCKGYTAADFSDEYCTERYIRNNLLAANAANGPCMCTMEYAPVCGTGSFWTLPNACAARCVGYADEEFAPCEIITLPTADTESIVSAPIPVGLGVNANRQTICIEPQSVAGPLLCAEYDSALGSKVTTTAGGGPEISPAVPGAPEDSSSAALSRAFTAFAAASTLATLAFLQVI